MEPVAWKYEIAAYADHRTDVGVVLNKRELSSAVPAEQITWTPLFAFDDRLIVGDAFRIADEAMMDMLMCHSLPDEAICIGFGGVLALTDEDGDVVRTLAEADAPVQEALDWLRRRKLAELVTADDGAECIYLPPNVLAQADAACGVSPGAEGSTT